MIAAATLVLASVVLTMATLTGAPPHAALCGGDFNAFLSAFAREAAAQKISPQVIQTAFAGLAPDARVIQLDRRQGVFKQSFEQFGPPRASPRREVYQKTIALFAQRLASE